ncbi:histone-lysine N-methyltransferase SETDB1-like isoform X3 [Centruroides vittatus]
MCFTSTLKKKLNRFSVPTLYLRKESDSPVKSDSEAEDTLSEYETKVTFDDFTDISPFHLEMKKNLYVNGCPPLKRKAFDLESIQFLKKHKTSKTFPSNRKYRVNGDIKTTIRSILTKSRFQEKLQHSFMEITEQMNVLHEKCKEIDGIYNKTEENMKILKSTILISVLKDDTSTRKLEEIQYSSQNSRNTSDALQQARARFTLQLMRADSNLAQLAPNQHIKSPKHSNTLNNTTKNFVKDVDIVGQYEIQKPVLPGIGPVIRKELSVGMRVYAMRASYLGVWQRARIVNIKTNILGKKYCKIKFDMGKANSNRAYLPKHLAYFQPPDVILSVGSRVVAHYRDEHWSPRSSLYAGVIAEPPKLMNRYRYLVFFDDGYAQYVKHNEVYLVCESRKEVWEDIHPDSKEFIKSYLQQYPERPMVKLQPGQIVRTEWNGQWWIARVLEVDASLVKMVFHADHRTEWIYRGSTRLAPLYDELAAAQANRLSGKNRRHNVVTKKKHQPYVEYTRGTEEPTSHQITNIESTDTNNKLIQAYSRPQVARKHTSSLPELGSRNVAKKSTTQLPQESSYNAMSTLTITSQSGQRETCKIQRQKIIYVPHTCCPECLKEENLEKLHKSENPLWIPILTGWERQIAKHRAGNRRIVFYQGPCGRRLRNIVEVHRYLMETKSKLMVDLFCFDSYVNTSAEFVPSVINCQIKDITQGKEPIPVPCINSINREYPPYVEYSSTRFPAKGVNLNLDEEFLCGCDCEDNCQDRNKCQCQQLTVAATEALPTGRLPNAGYYYKRLHEPLITGVYECNPRCKCNSSCVNRVVQGGLKVQLQVFKTERRGWGIRSLNDIPQGMFICIYAGQLLTEQGANEDGNQFGDEYLAELDHIEVVERFKEGYESDVIDPEGNKTKQELKTDSDNDSIASDCSDDSERKDNHSSDSDFDIDSRVRIEPVSHATRSKQKLIELETDSSSSTAEKSSVPNSVSDYPDIADHWMKSDCFSKSKRFTNGIWMSSNKLGTNEEFKDDDTNIELPDLDTEYSNASKSDLSNDKIFEEFDKIKLIRRPRVTKRLSTNDSSDHKESLSDSEDDSIKTEEDVECNKSLKSVTNTRDIKMPIISPLRNSGETKFNSLRSYFNEEYCYIMDAKTCGNIGRYLNHSCCPNVFVQNVFVDTHDLRFPWVAFFAMTHIRAGTELTWDYNYDVGSVPGKVMYCYCESAECRGRLL